MVNPTYGLRMSVGGIAQDGYHSGYCRMRIVHWYMPLIFALCACNGMIKSKLWTQENFVNAASTNQVFDGIFGYYQRPVLEVDEMTQLSDKDGKFVTALCKHVMVQSVKNIMDYEHPVQIWYEPGLLEANKFSVQLNNSMYTAVNSESTPDQGKTLLNLSEAAGNLAKIAALAPAKFPSKPAAPGTERPDCNAAPSFVRYEPLPHIPATVQ